MKVPNNNSPINLRELRDALITWSFMEEAALEALVPCYIQGLEAKALTRLITLYLDALKHPNLLCIKHVISICRFLIAIIQYRQEAADYLKGDALNALFHRMRMDYKLKDQECYNLFKKTIVWMATLNLPAVVDKLRHDLCSEEFHAGTIDVLADVTSLYGPVTIPYIEDLLPVVSKMITKAHSKHSLEVLCHAIRRLSYSVLHFIEESDRCNIQIMKAMHVIKTNLSKKLRYVSAKLRESVNLALEPFTAPTQPKQKKTQTKDVELQSLPQTALLAENRKILVKEMQQLGDVKTIKNLQIEISELVTSLLSGRKITKHVLRSMLKTMDEGIPKPKMVAAMFFSEALKHPRLIKKKYQETAIHHLLRIITEHDGSLCRVAIEALRNSVTGAPELVKGDKDRILPLLKSLLSKTKDVRVIFMTLKLMSSMILLLKTDVLSKQYINACRDYMDYPSESVQVAAVTLLKDLTESCCSFLYGRYGEEVKRMIPTVLLRMNSYDSMEMRILSSQTLESCQRYIQGNYITGLFRRQAEPINNEPDSHYFCLAFNHPKLIKKVLLQTPDYLLNSTDKDAVVSHIGFLKDVIDEDAVKDEDIRHLSQALTSLLSEDHPLEVRKATKKAMSILATKWKNIGSADK